MPIQIPHIAAARDFPLRGATLAAGFQSALIAPLDRLGRAPRRPRHRAPGIGLFPENTVALIKTLANQSVLAMSNAKLFEQVQEKNKQLAIANEHKSLFFANMSHELRTPLNAVLGYTELMQDGIYGDMPERAKQVLARIQTNGAHLLSLINDVLDISKIEAGELSLSLSDYSLRAVIETVVNATGSLAQAKGLRISTDIAPDLPIGRGDERRLTQVLLNIVSNAIKFTDKGGVMIRAKASGNDFKLAVKDTGPGIAPEDQARIFEAFHQVDSTITKQKGGTGLGLSISKRFIEMHGGAISLDLHLRRRLDIQSANSGPRRSADGGGMTKRILVVEDTEDNRQILRDVLSDAGFDLIEAGDGEEGVRMAAEFQSRSRSDGYSAAARRWL